MNDLMSSSKVFLKRNSSTILTVAGITGVVATVVTAVKAAPKATALLEEAKNDKGEELTKLEKIKVAGPTYIPTVILGASTIACILGANILNKKAQASMISAYALMENSYKDYKKKVNELYGEDADSNIRTEIVKGKYDENLIPPIEDGKRLYYDYYSGRYFEASPYEVQKAEYNLNRSLTLSDCAYLNEWYSNLGLDPIDHGYDFGWVTYKNMDMYWQMWVDFKHEKVVMDDGLECIIISFEQDPYGNFED